MREIKFRAWNDLDKTMIGWPVLKCSNGLAIDVMLGKVKYHTAMQYTGLKDKNGVEIYEGDIYNVDGYGIGKVVIDPFQGVSFDGLGSYGLVSLSHVIQMGLDYDIAGNIHQNPELIND